MKDSYFTVTIDVEADNVWANQASLSLSNLSRLPEFQRICELHNIIPTYLLSYETLSDDSFISFLSGKLQQNRIEIGIHPHVWTIPELNDEEGYVDRSILGYYQSMLEEKVLIQKLDTLHNKVYEKLGREPKIHRAGRWGLCVRTVKWLEQRKYLADSSVVPFKTFSDSTLDSDSHPDYHSASQLPYKMSQSDIIQSGDLTVTEIPVTNTNRFLLPSLINLADNIQRDYRTDIPKRILRKMNIYPMELRPFPGYPYGTLSRIIQMGIKQNLPVLNLMFHSSELMEGGSPYSSDLRNTDRIWKHIEEAFKCVNAERMNAIGVLGALRQLTEAKYFAR